MGMIASQITSLTTIYSDVYSGADQRKHQGSTSLAFVQGIYRGPVNSPHKWPVMQGQLGLILGLRPANERWRYFVTTSLIGWVQA